MMAGLQTFAEEGTTRREARPCVVFITYNGLLDPLGTSQMLSYLERLNREWPICILSFERAAKLAHGEAVAAMRARLRAQNIEWLQLRYHHRPSLPATTYDMLSGVLALRRWMRRRRVGLLHARGYVPMEIATNATRSTPTLFDIRGLQAEEYVDGGVWKEGELKWRLAKRSESRFFRRAAGAVVLTQAIRPYVTDRFGAVRGSVPPLEVIPCCVDLDEFRFISEARERLRAELGVSKDTVVFAYSGSLGTWYESDAMARFARAFSARCGKQTFLLWLVNNDASSAHEASQRAGLTTSQYRVTSSPADRVTQYLSAADVGMALIKPCFSKRSSSPTKYGEYLAAGLPIVINRDVGDGAVIAERGGAVALTGTETEDHNAGADELLRLLTQPRTAFRAIAKSLFDVDQIALPAYRRLYSSLVSS